MEIIPKVLQSDGKGFLFVFIYIFWSFQEGTHHRCLLENMPAKKICGNIYRKNVCSFSAIFQISAHSFGNVTIWPVQKVICSSFHHLNHPCTLANRRSRSTSTEETEAFCHSVQFYLECRESPMFAPSSHKAHPLHPGLVLFKCSHDHHFISL